MNPPSPRPAADLLTAPSTPVLDRRGFIRGGAALGGALAGAAALGSPVPAAAALSGESASSLPLVTPLVAQKVRENFGYCAHPCFQSTAYRHIDQWMEQLARMGVRYFRGLYVGEGNAATMTAVRAARRHNIQWLMTVTPEVGATLATTRARVAHIARYAADVCKGIEGQNEPQHARSAGEVIPADWARIAVAHQKVIWRTVRRNPSLAHVTVVGPSLHDVMAARSYSGSGGVGGPRHYHQLASAGIKQYQDVAGLHRYPADDEPVSGLAQRLALVHSAYGKGYPMWMTEWGYHNALSTSAGHKPVSAAAAAVYVPRAILQYARLGYPLTRYELLDDPDGGAKDNHQSNFGAIRVGATAGAAPSSAWSQKPEAGAVRAMLTALKDDGPAFRPKPVSVRVSGRDVDYVVTAKRDGTARVWMWRELPVWNEGRTIAVDSVPVTVTDRRGTRTISVGAGVRSIALR